MRLHVGVVGTAVLAIVCGMAFAQEAAPAKPAKTPKATASEAPAPKAPKAPKTLPENLLQVAEAQKATKFVAAIKAAKLEDKINAANTFVFIPDDEAMTALAEKKLTDDQMKVVLQNLIVVPFDKKLKGLGQLTDAGTLKTVGGASLKVTTEPNPDDPENAKAAIMKVEGIEINKKTRAFSNNGGMSVTISKVIEAPAETKAAEAPKSAPAKTSAAPAKPAPAPAKSK